MPIFSPKVNYTISASATSVNVSLSDMSSPIVRIYNSGPNKAFVRWGNATQSAANTDMCIAPDSVEAFDKGQATGLAAITSGGTETALIYLTFGVGD